MTLPLATPAPGRGWGRLSLGRVAVIVRDIARCGLAGLVTGVLVAGIGGRVVMRAAALLVPEAAGRFTENGNRIGEVTLSGTAGLVAVGLFFGLAGATLWAVVSPWIPGGFRLRALLAMPVAIALAGVSLVQAGNPDFAVLRHDALTVILLLLLVATSGLTISVLDSWLDRRLPAASASAGWDALYVVLAVAGGLLILPLVLATYIGGEPLVGIALVAVGLSTMAWWWRRYVGRTERPTWLMAIGHGSLLLAVLLGVLALGPDVAVALGWA